MLTTALEALAGAELNLGWPDSSLTRLREMETLAANAGRRGLVRSARLAMARAHEARGSADSALFYHRRFLLEDSTASNTTRWDTYNRLANHYLVRQRPDSARKYFELVRAQITALTPPGVQVTPGAQEIAANFGLGLVHLARGMLDSARIEFTRALNGTAGRDRAVVLRSIANIDRRVGNADSSLATYRRALTLTGGSRTNEAPLFAGMAATYRQLGFMDTAMVFYREALERSSGEHNRDGMRSALQALADVLLDSDMLDSSLIYSRRALVIANEMDSPLPRAAIEHHIGVTYLFAGQLDSAKVYLEQGLHRYRALAVESGEAAALANLGLLRLKTVSDDSTVSLLRAALGLRQRSQDKAGEAEPRLHLARAFARAGHADSARVHAQEALALARAIRDRGLEGSALAEIGRSFAARGTIDSARVYFAQAIAVLRAAGAARAVRLALADMAELFRSEGAGRDLPRATAYYDSAAAVVDEARRGTTNEMTAISLSEDQVDVFGGWTRAWIGRRQEVGDARSAASALGAVERGRAQSLVSMLSRLESSQRAGALTRLRPTVGADLTAEVDSLLEPLRTSRSAALTYLLTADTLFAWFLSPGGTLELRPPVAITDEELQRLVRSSRRALGADDSRSAALAPDELGVSDSVPVLGNPDDDWKRLAELLLPVDLETEVPPGTPIVIVPHGAIGLVPFSALARTRASAIRRTVAGAKARADRVDNVVSLGRRNPLRYAPSFAALRASESRTRVAVVPALRTAAAQRAWRATRTAAIAPGESASSQAAPSRATGVARTVATNALVVGNPSMPYVYSGRWTNRAKLQSLPGAEAESRTIATQLGASPLTGRAATESRIRSRMATAPLIHFATHGLAYGTSSAARRSYVAFAPDSTHDGLLTMGELMDDQSLALSAELVVLSACQTGLGDMKKAEGSIGLQRAFLAKGARSVLVSLWNVDDTATRLLMEKFYAYWLDPTVVRTKAQALQMAQEAVRRTPGDANPKYWAAFQLVGAD